MWYLPNTVVLLCGPTRCELAQEVLICGLVSRVTQSCTFQTPIQELNKLLFLEAPSLRSDTVDAENGLKRAESGYQQSKALGHPEPVIMVEVSSLAQIKTHLRVEKTNP